MIGNSILGWEKILKYLKMKKEEMKMVNVQFAQPKQGML